MKSTKIFIPKTISRSWHEIDASKNTFGRVASEIANHLRGIVDAIRQLARTLVTIFTGGVHLRGQTFTANTTKVLSHSLGRPYLGVTVTSRSAAGIETIVALTGGMTSDRYIALQFTQTGTYDVLVF